MLTTALVSIVLFEFLIGMMLVSMLRGVEKENRHLRMAIRYGNRAYKLLREINEGYEEREKA